MIPNSFIQELLYRTDIAEVVGRYVQLKKAGANLSGLCPFHREKSPSFSVSPAKQFYHCFGCGAHGSAISFLMDHLGLTFPEAVEQLAAQQGLEVPHEQGSQQAGEEKARHLTLVDRMNAAQAFYEQSLRRYPDAVAYLKGRGLTGQVAKRFGLGFSPPGFQGLATVFADYESSPDLPDCGLVIDPDEQDGRKGRRYDRFRERIMFPIRNVRGDIIGFGGRVLGKGEPKYLNSPETPLFSKGQELYGLFEARSAIRARGYVFVTEGYMDVVALSQWGFENAVATLGTAVTPHHVQRLFRHTDRVVYSFDGDTAGRKAAWRALEASLAYATETRRIEFLFLPPEHDPDSFIREMGAEAFDSAVAGAQPLSVYLSQEMARRNPLDQVEGRAAAVAMLRPLLQQVPPGAYRVALMTALSEPLRCSPAELEQQLGLRRPDGEGALRYTPGRRSDGGSGSGAGGSGGGFRRGRAPGGGGARPAYVSPAHRLATLVLAAPAHAALCEPLRVCIETGQSRPDDALQSLCVLLATVSGVGAGAQSHVAALCERFRGTVHEAWVDAVWADACRLDEQIDFETEIAAVMYQCLDVWLTAEINTVAAAGLTDSEQQAYYRGLNEKRRALKQQRG